MSRNNVFKLSGNMALGTANDPYPNNNNNDFDNIKNSLKLLKAKKAEQKMQDYPPEPKNTYGGSYSSSSQQRQPPLGKNLGSNDYPSSYNYPQSNIRTTNQSSNSYKDVYQDPQYNDYKPKRVTQNYEQQNNDYKPKRIAQTYEEPQYKQKRNVPTYQEANYQQDRNQYSKPPLSKQQQPRQQDYSRQPRGGNQFQERTIKQINRENRVQIRQYDPSELIQCREGCGRKFNPDSIDKHEGICRKVFQKKRKEFNAQEQRIVANQQKKLMKRGELVEKKIEEKKAKQKVPKWKAQSLQLRVGIKQSQGDGSYKLTREQQQMMDANKASNTVKCPYCGRTFNEEPAKKHVPFCESQQKKNQMKRR